MQYKTSKNLKSTATALVVLAILALLTIMVELRLSERAATILLISGFGFILIASFLAHIAKSHLDWNTLPFDLKCKYMSEELKSHKRNWYLTPIGGDRYIAIPLRPTNLGEVGEGEHRHISEQDVRDYLSQKKLDNAEFVETILKQM